LPDSHFLGEGITLNGRFAQFETNVFEGYAYEVWHTLAFLAIDADRVALREDAYIEVFTSYALRDAASFHPHRIYLPIE